jgi:NlpC/P60 family putative phage cell wall peptidase
MEVMPELLRGPVTAEQIIDEARTWVGTPYRHQGRQQTVAVDCVGLIFGVCRAVGIGDAEFWADINYRWRGYSRLPDGRTLRDAFGRWLPEYPPHEARPGDMLLISMRGSPRHTAILTDRNTIIHAHSEAKGCVESMWAGAWKVDTTGAYRITEVGQV